MTITRLTAARRLREQNVSFDPRSLSGLALWLDASDSSAVTLNGTTVSEWRDKSGNARHASQSTAARQPTYTTAGQNSRNVITFASGRVLTMSVPLGPAFTILLVATPSTQANSYILACGASFGSSPAIISRFTFSGVVRDWEFYHDDMRNNVSTTDRIQIATTQAGYSVVGATHIDGGSVFGYLNGPQAATKATAASFAGDKTMTLIGASNAAATTNPAAFNIAELIIYSRVLSATERGRVTRQLGRRWNITIT